MADVLFMDGRLSCNKSDSMKWDPAINNEKADLNCWNARKNAIIHTALAVPAYDVLIVIYDSRCQTHAYNVPNRNDPTTSSSPPLLPP